MPDEKSEGLITLHSFYEEARPPVPADNAALGNIPISAFQHCEAMRSASSYGYYVFPPKDIQLRFDGYQTFVAQDDRWIELRHISFGEHFEDHWNSHCPPHMMNCAPNFLSSLAESGVVQIWTGFFIQTAPGWATQYRPLININKRRDLTVFEAIVETDEFAPCPLFVNIALRATDQEIIITKEFPLFQIQPIPKEAYQQSRKNPVQVFSASDEHFDWEALKETLRIPNVSQERKTAGQYGANIRRINKGKLSADSS